MSALTTAPKFIAPATKAAHKEAIFSAIKHLLSIALSFAVVWGNAPHQHDRDFLDWIEDVVKSLPIDEGTLPECTVMMFNKILKRSTEFKLQVIEHVDPSVPAADPVYLECSDDTSTLIEQVPSAPLRLSSHAKFEFKGNTSRLLPTKFPMTLTFTPLPSENLSVPHVPAMSYDVSKEGIITERDEPLTFTDQGIPTSDPFPPLLPDTQPQSSPTPIQPALIYAGSSTSMSAAEKRNSVNFSAALTPGPTSNHSHTSKKRGRKVKTRRIRTSRESPAPSVPDSSLPTSTTITSSTTAALATPPQHPTAYYGGNPDSVYAPGDAPDRPFNHFPVHPHANDGRPPLGGTVKLFRAYAFNNKSHPELFWHESFGEKPGPGDKITVEDCLSIPTKSQGAGFSSTPECSNSIPPPTTKSTTKEARRSGREGSPGTSHTKRPTETSASGRKGKKRAREEMEECGEEKLRYTRRLRSNNRKAEHEQLAKFANRISGIKNAVVNFAGGAFMK